MLKKFLDFEHGKEPTDPLEAGAMRRFLRQGKLRTGMMDMDVEKFTTSDKPVQGRKAQAVQWVVDLAGKTYSLGDTIPKLTNAMENFKDDVRQLNELSNGHSLTMKYVDGDLVEVAKTSDGKYKINGKNATHEQVMDAFADHAMDFPMSWTLDMTKAKGLSHMQRKMGGFGKIIGNILPYTQWFTGTIDTPFKPGLVTRALQFDNNAHFSTDPKLVKSNGLKITQGALRRLTTMSIMEGIGADTGDDKDVQARTAFGLSAGALVRQGADNRHLAINPGTNNPLVGTLVLSKVVNYITAQLGGAFALHSAVGARIAAKAKGEKAEELTPRQHAMIQAHMKATAGNIANEKDIDSMMQRGGDGMLRAFNAAWKGKVDKDVYKQEMPGRIMRVALDSVSPVLADIGDAVLGLSMPQWSTRKVFDEKGRAVDEPVPEMLTRIFFHSADRQVESSEQAKKWGANIGDKVNENLVKPLRAEMDKARAEWKRDETNMEAKEKYELAKSWHNASKRILADELNTLKKSARLGARSHGLGGIAGHEMMQMQTPAPKVEQSAEEKQ